MSNKLSTRAALACALLAAAAQALAQPALPLSAPEPAAAGAPPTAAWLASRAMPPEPARAPRPDAVELADDAPDRHVVARGDTLWDIAGKFLKDPWRWPQVWQLNRDQIRNPHLIYPGEIVYLDRSGPVPRLRLGRAVGAGASTDTELRTERLGPRVRAEPLAEAAIPTVPARLIEPFLNRPLIVEAQGLRQHPRILAAPDARVYLGRGDLVYARGIEHEQVADWHIYRPARPILDPDTREPIALEALHIGSARLERAGDIARLRIVSASEEVGEGDRLMPAVADRPVNFAPRLPEAQLRGRIVSVHRGLRQVGRHGVIAIDLGAAHGLEAGHVLAVRTAGRVVSDREAVDRRTELVRLPDLDVGKVLVFKVFDRIAYALVMDASRAMEVGDAAVTP